MNLQQNQILIDRSKKFLQFFEVGTASKKNEFLVLHHIQASSSDHAIKQLCEHQVSAHFLLDEEGKIFELVEETNIAYHAGTSFWRGIDGLNKFSIGIEFINSSPFEKKFNDAQIRSGILLCKYLIDKHKIAAQNIVGHSDIAYFKEGEGENLDRKQDPSHLFPWRVFAENGVGIFPSAACDFTNDKLLFEFGNKAREILKIKTQLREFGYRVKNLNDEFDLEMQALVRVFHRRFNQQKFQNFQSDSWYLSSQEVLLKLINKLNNSLSDS